MIKRAERKLRGLNQGNIRKKFTRKKQINKQISHEEGNNMVKNIKSIMDYSDQNDHKDLEKKNEPILPQDLRPTLLVGDVIYEGKKD